VARDDSVSSLIERLELPFNALGLDPYGISKEHLKFFFGFQGFLYKTYFRVRAHGLENVPARGRAMLVGNHSGGLPIDGGMVIASLFFDKDPPRLVQGMVDKFVNRIPVASTWYARWGQVTGLPEHAERLLNDDRVLMVFPEGHNGTAKLYPQRFSLVNFGTGFMRLALKTKSPIVPFGFIGGGDAIPTVHNSKLLGRLVGAPYVPVTPYGAALPLPVRLSVRYGEAMRFEGDGNEEDALINGYVEQVKARIAALIEQGRSERGT
jgi:1-acyl-sn-glycerol-3-phosphate acyltransferase